MDPIKHIKHTFRDVRLTGEERALMREVLLARIRATETNAPAIPSPYAGFFMTLTFQRISAFVALFAVALTSLGGVTLAAEDAVPGETMYAVKVHVSEPLSSLAALTPEAKAAVATTRAERRLKEAEVLAVRGELKADVAEDLSDRFTESAEAAAAHIEGLTEDDTEKAVTASAELQSVFSAHGRILDDIIAARNGETEEKLAMLRTDLAEREIAIGEKREAFQTLALAQGNEAGAQFFKEVERDAEEAVRDLTERSEELPADDVLALESRVAVINEAIDEGRAKQELGAYEAAFSEFARARTVISVGKRLLDAKAEFETKGEAVVADEDTSEEVVNQEAANLPVAAETATLMTMSAKVAATTSATTTATTTEETEVREERTMKRGNWHRPIRINLNP